MAGLPVITSRTALVETRYTPFTDSDDGRPKPPHVLNFKGQLDDNLPRTTGQSEISGQMSIREGTAKLTDHGMEEIDDGETDSEVGKEGSQAM